MANRQSRWIKRAIAATFALTSPWSGCRSDAPEVVPALNHEPPSSPKPDSPASNRSEPDAAAVRAVVDRWRLGTNPLSFELTISLRDPASGGSGTIDERVDGWREAGSVKGVVDFCDDDVALFRLHPWAYVHRARKRSSSEAKHDASNSSQESTPSVAPVSKSDVGESVLFYKRGKVVVLRGLDGSWSRVTVDDVIGVARDNSGKAVRLYEPTFVYATLDGEGLNMENTQAAENASPLIDPRRLITWSMLQGDAMRVTTRQIDGEDAVGVTMRLKESVALEICSLARGTEPNAHVHGEHVDGEIEITLRRSLEWSTIELRLDNYTVADPDRPTKIDRRRQVVTLVPRKQTVLPDMPKAAAELLHSQDKR